MNDVLERLAERGTPAGAEAMVGRVEAELAGLRPAAMTRRRPWLAAGLTAALVLIAVGGGAWLLARTGDGTLTPAGLSTAQPEWPEFEMWFEWLRPGLEPADDVEAALARGRPVERFLFHSMGEWRMETMRRRGGLAGELEARSGQAVHDRHHYDLGLAREPPVPLDAEGLLPTAWFGELAPSLAWVRARPVEDSEPAPVRPSHPLAAFAAESDRMRMEFTEDGIPVLLESEDGPLYRVLSIQRRRVPVAEIEAGLANHEAADVATGDRPGSRVVRRVEGDGFVAELIASDRCLDAVVLVDGSRAWSTGSCDVPSLGPEEALASAGSVALPDGRTVMLYHGGPIPDFARVEVTHPDGVTFVDDVVDGYWLLAVPTDAPPGLVSFRAFDGDGLQIASAEMEATPGE